MYIPLVLKLTMHSIRKFLIHITVFSVIHSIALDKLSSDMHSYTFCLDVYYFIFFVVKMPGAHMPGAHMPGADMTGAYIPGAHMPRAHITGAHMPGRTCLGAHMPGARTVHPLQKSTPTPIFVGCLLIVVGVLFHYANLI
jgi:hypothetical protein